MLQNSNFMKQSILSIVTLLIISISVFAQKEVFFNDKKLEDIKVESLQGLEVHWYSDPLSFFKNKYMNDKSYSIPLYIGYFNEKRIASCWTLNTTIGLNNYIGRSQVYEVDTTSGYNLIGYNYSIKASGKYKTTYGLGLKLGLEPRWYWDYKRRYQFGKSQLNTGVFLIFPLLLQTPLLQTPEPLLNRSWIPSYFSVTTSFTPSIGYRKAISKRMFLEGSIGVGVTLWIGKDTYNNTIFVSKPLIAPQIMLKAAYTFK